MGLTVNGEAVPEQLIAAEAESLRARFRQLTPEQRHAFGFDNGGMDSRAQEWARENVVERVLLRQKALEDPEPVPPEVFEKSLEDIYKRHGGREKFQESGLTEDFIRREAEATVKLDRLLGKIASRVKPPKTKDVAAYYRNHRERWQVGESARAAHIVKHINEDVSEEKAREAIDAAKKELDAGANFEELADRLSDCPGNGGSLGWFPRGQMVEEFEEVVFKMKPGRVSDVFRSSFGFHIARLYEIRPPAVRPLHEVREVIEQELKRERETKAVEAFVDELREQAVVEDVAPVS